MTESHNARTFADLDLAPEVVEALTKMGLTHPTEVQARAIPLVAEGRDLLVQSRTGTGKTLAFLLPILERIDPGARGVQALVVAPTRELATQVGAVFARVGRARGVRIATLTGGVAYGEQLRALRQGVQAVVGTPGRLVDHLERGTLDLGRCQVVVLDESDEILDMGFQEDLEKLLGALPTERQSLLFSATFPEGIEEIARRYMRDPQRLGLGAGTEAASTLHHVSYEVTKDSKYEALVNVIHVEQPELAILFCHTKLETENLTKRLAAEGFKAGYLNGDLPQALRTKTLEAFRQHEITLLVATDVAARGIDVRGISHVINYDIPRGAETYIHRSGRTGRAGREGTVLNLITPYDRSKMAGLVREAKLQMEWRPAPQAEEVRKRLREGFFEELVNRIDANEFDDFREFATDLIGNLDPISVVAALLQDVQSATGQLAAGYEVQVPKKGEKPLREKPLREKPKREQRDRGPRTQEEGMSRLRFSVGKADRIVPGYLVRVICDKAHLTKGAIGAITLMPHHSLVDVRSDVANQVVSALNNSVDNEGRKLSVKFA